MEQSNELKKLLEQKKELERKIKALQVGAIYDENVKIDEIQLPTTVQVGRKNLYYKYNYMSYKGDEKTRWSPIVSASSVDELLQMIPSVIDNLKKFYQKATETRLPLER